MRLLAFDARLCAIRCARGSGLTLPAPRRASRLPLRRAAPCARAMRSRWSRNSRNTVRWSRRRFGLAADRAQHGVQGVHHLSPVPLKRVVEARELAHEIVEAARSRRPVRAARTSSERRSPTPPTGTARDARDRRARRRCDQFVHASLRNWSRTKQPVPARDKRLAPACAPSLHASATRGARLKSRVQRRTNRYRHGRRSPPARR